MYIEHACVQQRIDNMLWMPLLLSDWLLKSNGQQMSFQQWVRNLKPEQLLLDGYQHRRWNSVLVIYLTYLSHYLRKTDLLSQDPTDLVISGKLRGKRGMNAWLLVNIVLWAVFFYDYYSKLRFWKIHKLFSQIGVKRQFWKFFKCTILHIQGALTENERWH